MTLFLTIKMIKFYTYFIGIIIIKYINRFSVFILYLQVSCFNKKIKNYCLILFFNLLSQYAPFLKYVIGIKIDIL